MADKFKVVIGLSIVKEGGEDFADFGLVYRGMDYEDIVKVEAAFARHAETVVKAMEGMVGELVQMGVDKAAEKKGGVSDAIVPSGNPGAIR